MLLFLVKTHSLLHIEDGVSTGLTLFSRFCPSESRREVENKTKQNKTTTKKKKNKKTKEGGGAERELGVDV